MRKLVSLCTLLVAAVLAAAALKTDVAADIEESFDDPPLPSSEPITGTPFVPAPGSETPQKDPFKPYDVGDPASIIKYEELSPEEQAVIDRGRNVDNWRDVHDGYANAASELGKKGRAEAAAHQLGVDELAAIGVVP